MRDIDEYSTTLEALGRLASRTAIHNMFNKVHASTNDGKLRNLLGEMMHVLSV